MIDVNKQTFFFFSYYFVFKKKDDSLRNLSKLESQKIIRYQKNACNDCWNTLVSYSRNHMAL